MMVMKKGRRMAVESSPSSAAYRVGEDARARFRHQSLLQDYEELLKETEAKGNQLQKTHQKKLKLLAEVKFLQKRYKCLLKDPSQKTTYRLKKRSRKIPSPRVCHAQAPNPVIQTEANQKDKSSHMAREATVPSTSAVLDLNQASSPNGEEMEEFQMEWEPLKVDKLNKYSTEGDSAANDLKLSICRDVGNGVSRAGKRKITWQDQVNESLFSRIPQGRMLKDTDGWDWQIGETLVDILPHLTWMKPFKNSYHSFDYDLPLNGCLAASESFLSDVSKYTKLNGFCGGVIGTCNIAIEDWIF